MAAWVKNGAPGDSGRRQRYPGTAVISSASSEWVQASTIASSSRLLDHRRNRGADGSTHSWPASFASAGSTAPGCAADNAVGGGGEIVDMLANRRSGRARRSPGSSKSPQGGPGTVPTTGMSHRAGMVERDGRCCEQ
jgi:hypothetical protein